MKALVTLGISLLTFSLWASGPEKSGFIDYDPSVGSWEQPNPIFRWPLPSVEGEVYLNLQFVWLGDDNADEVALKETQAYLDDVYNHHGIHINYKTIEKTTRINVDQDLSDWKNLLPEKPGQLTVYVLPFDGSEQARMNIYSTNQVVSTHALVPLQNQQEFKVFVAKNIGHMLGLLPTYFESPVYGVSSEDGDNCGNAGDFVCDTPFDYLGLRNDVKKRNCRYKGDIGTPDAGNIMSNSWTECMDHITPEQANKIKYNLSVIPVLQKMLDTQSTIALNIDTYSFESEDKASLE